MNRLLKYGWNKKPIVEGYYNGLYKECESMDLGVEVTISSEFTNTSDYSITIYEVIFYQMSSLQRGKETFEEIKKEHILPLKEITKCFFSEIIYDLTRATMRN